MYTIQLIIFCYAMYLFQSKVQTSSMYILLKHRIHRCFQPKLVTPIVAKKIETIPEIPYEKKYEKMYEKVEPRPLTSEELDNLKQSILLEMTPVGNVVMFYNSQKETFDYYCDKIVPYRFLESVSRKYVSKFDCKIVRADTKENRYSQLGKIVNFSFLKKANKILTNKKLNMSFKDYKNMNL